MIAGGMALVESAENCAESGITTSPHTKSAVSPTGADEAQSGKTRHRMPDIVNDAVATTREPKRDASLPPMMQLTPPVAMTQKDNTETERGALSSVRCSTEVSKKGTSVQKA